jgi:rod shape determining protein RodA
MSLSYDHRPSTGRPLILRVDPALLASAVIVAVIGVVMVYSVTRPKLALAGDSPHYYLDRQAGFVLLGIGAMILVALIDYRWFEHASILFYVLIVLALLAMFAVGQSELGATRWINVGPLALQPSAFATLVEIVVVAAFCSRRPDGLQQGDLLKILALMAIPIVLVVKQPDLGSGIIMCTVLLVMLIVAGIPTRYLILLLAAAAFGAFCMIHFGILKQYQLQRLTSFLNQSKTGQGTYNLAQSKLAIGNGGFWGKGLFQGTQTNDSYVPEQYTDFIFSAVAEQLGFVGATTVIALLGVIVWRVVHVAQIARDPFGRLIATGSFTLIAFSAFENAGMTMGIMPIAGIPLPFLSYGGSSTLAFFVAVGMAMSVQLRSQR